MSDRPRDPADAAEAFDAERDGPLLSAYMDGELGDEQTARVEALLAADPKARAEMAGLRRLQEVTSGMRLKEAPPEVWEAFWSNLYNRTERSLGWLLLSCGFVLIGGYGLYELFRGFFLDSGEPWYLKFGVFGVCTGVLVLLVSLIRERVYRRSRSRYKDVVR